MHLMMQGILYLYVCTSKINRIKQFLLSYGPVYQQKKLCTFTLLNGTGKYPRPKLSYVSMSRISINLLYQMKMKDIFIHGRYRALCYGTTLDSSNCLKAAKVGCSAAPKNQILAVHCKPKPGIVHSD